LESFKKTCGFNFKPKLFLLALADLG